MRIASLLLGYPAVWSDTNSAVISNPSRLLFNYFGGFIQDDFRVSEKLTLTYGLRMESEGGLGEKDDGIVVAFDQNAVSPLDAMVNKAGTPLAGPHAVRRPGVRRPERRADVPGRSRRLRSRRG